MGWISFGRQFHVPTSTTTVLGLCNKTLSELIVFFTKPRAFTRSHPRRIIARFCGIKSSRGIAMLLMTISNCNFIHSLMKVNALLKVYLYVNAISVWEKKKKKKKQPNDFPPLWVSKIDPQYQQRIVMEIIHLLRSINLTSDERTWKYFDGGVVFGRLLWITIHYTSPFWTDLSPPKITSQGAFLIIFLRTAAVVTGEQ